QGLFHVAAPEALSRIDLMNLLYDAARAHRDDLVIEITPCRLHDLNFAEKRPLNTALSSEKLRRTIDWRFTPMAALCAEVAAAHFAAK
ncbi:MAG: hypothetical protein AB7M12_11060, partial [Hyphomonadaceae bacterium]